MTAFFQDFSDEWKVSNWVVVTVVFRVQTRCFKNGETAAILFNRNFLSMELLLMSTMMGHSVVRQDLTMVFGTGSRGQMEDLALMTSPVS